MFKLSDYYEPTEQYIGRGDDTEKLYGLEEKRTAAIKAAAKELARLLEIPEGKFWTHTMPQALYDVLDSQEPMAAYLAACAFKINTEEKCEWARKEKRKKPTKSFSETCKWAASIFNGSVPFPTTEKEMDETARSLLAIARYLEIRS